MSVNPLLRDIAIDMGTTKTAIYLAGQGIVLLEPSVVAISQGPQQEVVAVGGDALHLLRASSSSKLLQRRPIHDGIIADYDVAAIMLRSFLRELVGKNPLLRLRAVFSVPTGISAAERRVFHDAAHAAGVKQVYMPESIMAAATGAGLPVGDDRGFMVVDIGGGTAEIAVLSLGGIVLSKSIRTGGRKMDDALLEYLHREYGLLITAATAELIKNDLGSALPLAREEFGELQGTDANGDPKAMDISSTEVYLALKEPLQVILAAIKGVLERIPPDMAGDIMENGICLTGGCALLRNLDELIAAETGMPVFIAENPAHCVALGAGHMAEKIDILRKAVDYGASEE